MVSVVEFRKAYIDVLTDIIKRRDDERYEALWVQGADLAGVVDKMLNAIQNSKRAAWLKHNPALRVVARRLGIKTDAELRRAIGGEGLCPEGHKWSQGTCVVCGYAPDRYPEGDSK